MDYKLDQNATRQKLKQGVRLGRESTINLGINKFKRSGASKEYVRIYKENAWRDQWPEVKRPGNAVIKALGLK